jgi:hypothetical protein
LPSSLSNLINLADADFSYNAFYTDDNTLRAFLNSVDADWEETQTIAPTGISYDRLMANSVRISWLPIPYSQDPGGYRVLCGTSPGGPYLPYAMTLDKTISQMDFILPSPNAIYFLAVQTRTESHSNNKNALESEFSNEIKLGRKKIYKKR